MTENNSLNVTTASLTVTGEERGMSGSCVGGGLGPDVALFPYEVTGCVCSLV